jgi:hypothetical protein
MALANGSLAEQFAREYVQASLPHVRWGDLRETIMTDPRTFDLTDEQIEQLIDSAGHIIEAKIIITIE